MAHLAKYTLNSAQALFHHNLRHKDRKGEYVAYGGSKIDTTKTHLNYRLDPNTDPNEFITQRLSEIKVQKRADVKVYCSWVLTVPQNLPTEKHREFFESAYRFFCQDYGQENIVMASVHLDETTPHMHLGFVPVVREKKNQKKTRTGESLSQRTPDTLVHEKPSQTPKKRFRARFGVSGRHNH